MNFQHSLSTRTWPCTVIAAMVSVLCDTASWDVFQNTYPLQLFTFSVGFMVVFRCASLSELGCRDALRPACGATSPRNVNAREPEVWQWQQVESISRRWILAPGPRTLDARSRRRGQTALGINAQCPIVTVRSPTQIVCEFVRTAPCQSPPSAHAHRHGGTGCGGRPLAGLQFVALLPE